MLVLNIDNVSINTETCISNECGNGCNKIDTNHIFPIKFNKN